MTSPPERPRRSDGDGGKSVSPRRLGARALALCEPRLLGAPWRASPVIELGRSAWGAFRRVRAGEDGAVENMPLADAIEVYCQS